MGEEYWGLCWGSSLGSHQEYPPCSLQSGLQGTWYLLPLSFPPAASATVGGPGQLSGDPRNLSLGGGPEGKGQEMNTGTLGGVHTPLFQVLVGSYKPPRIPISDSLIR